MKEPCSAIHKSRKVFDIRDKTSNFVYPCRDSTNMYNLII